MTPRIAVVAVAALAVVAACNKGGEAEPAAAPAPTAEATKPAAPARPAEPERPAEPAEPAALEKPAEPAEPALDARAVDLCKALHTTPAERRAACCPGRNLTWSPYDSCAAQLSAALAGGKVTLDAAKVATCAAAIAKAHEGCDWVGTLTPPPPAECLGLVRGAGAAGAACTSSLECSVGLHCHGATSHDPGKCGDPLAAGAECGRGGDALAAQLRERRAALETECAGWCHRGRCADRDPEGTPCTASRSCAEGLRCVGGKCSAATPLAAGARCELGGCADGLVCIGGTCAARLGEGAPCTSSVECKGGCIKERGASAGRCGKKCARALPAVLPGPAKLAPRPLPRGTIPARKALKPKKK